MEIKQTGFILYTIKYKNCVYFYEHVLGLQVMYRKETLTYFDFYGTYLMVELEDEYDLLKASISDRDRVCLRLNVSNVKQACMVLDKHSIPYTYQEFDWGKIAKFRDPDGNLIGFRSAKEHIEDIKKG